MLKNKILVFLVFCIGYCRGYSEEVPHYLFFSPQMINTHLQGYSPEEKILIAKDLQVVKSIAFDKGKESKKHPFYLATAGGPGARKSTILERFLRNHSEFSQGVYLDPDQRGLRFMAHTYYCQSLCAFEIAKEDDFSLVIKRAYEKWRGASNYITLTLLEEALSKKNDLIHGTTSTGDYIPLFFKKLKEAGYEIILVVCSSSDSLKHKAIHYRNFEQRFYQSTPEDAYLKSRLFPQKMNSYFSLADTLYLYWSVDLVTPEILAAVLKEGKLEVKDKKAFRAFIGKYEEERSFLKLEGKELPSWEELLALYQTRF